MELLQNSQSYTKKLCQKNKKSKNKQTKQKNKNETAQKMLKNSKDA